MRSHGQREELFEEFNNYHEVSGEIQNLIKKMELLLKQKDTYPTSLENIEKQNQEILQIIEESKNLTNLISFENIKTSCQKKIESVEENIKNLGEREKICQERIIQFKRDITEKNQTFEREKTEILQLINQLNNTMAKKPIAQKAKDMSSYILDLIGQWTNPLIKFIRGILPEKILQFFNPKESNPINVSAYSNSSFKKELKEFSAKNFNIENILDTLRYRLKKTNSPTERNLIHTCIEKLTSLEKPTEEINELEKAYAGWKTELQGVENKLSEENKSLLKLLETKINIQDSINMITTTPQAKPENLPTNLDTTQSNEDNIDKRIHELIQSGSKFFSSIFASPSSQKSEDTAESVKQAAPTKDESEKKSNTPNP